MAREPNLFISHKHNDRRIADVVREFVEKWGRREVSVFQSSSAKAQSPEIGRALSDELKTALWKVGIVVLIYTTPDQDWQYCMWECGVATKPDSPDTRIVVLQCSLERPRVFTDQVSVDARDREDVQKFVRSFLTDSRFFPGSEKAVAPRFAADGREVHEAAEELFASLAKVLPRAEVAEWPAQPLVSLQLPLETVEKLSVEVGPSHLDSLVRESALLTAVDHQARQLFGIAEVRAGLSFKEFLERWAQQQPGASLEWSQEIVSQVARAARGEIPSLRWVYLRGTGGTARYAPALTRVRRVPALQAMQFDISFLPYDTLIATPVTARMLDRDGMVSVDLDQTPIESVRLTELADRCDEHRLSRIPFLQSAGRICMIVHRSMIDRYLARKARQTTDGMAITQLTLAQLVADEPDMKRVFESGFEMVGREARLAEASAKMAANRDCQDVFVTESGRRDEPVLGWITNVMITQALGG